MAIDLFFLNELSDGLTLAISKIAILTATSALCFRNTFAERTLALR